MSDERSLPEYMSLTDYGKSIGIKYPTLKKRYDKIMEQENNPLEGHCYIEGVRTIMLDEVGRTIIYNAGKEKPVIIEDDKSSELKTEVSKLKNMISQRDEEIARLQQMMSTQYILLEDHTKTEEELRRKEEELEKKALELKEAEKKAEDAEEGKKKVQETYEKNKKLFDYSQKLNADYRQEIDEKNEKLASVTAEKDDLSAEMEKLREEMAEMTKARDEALRESEENLNLGFFARLRKKKEKKNSN